jgi:hypothetical protein
MEQINRKRKNRQTNSKFSFFSGFSRCLFTSMRIASDRTSSAILLPFTGIEIFDFPSIPKTIHPNLRPPSRRHGKQERGSSATCRRPSFAFQGCFVGHSSFESSSRSHPCRLTSCLFISLRHMLQLNIQHVSVAFPTSPEIAFRL